MSACLQLREPGIAASAAGACSAFPGHARGLGRGGARRLPAAPGGGRVRAASGASGLAASGRGSRPLWLACTRGHQGLGAVLARPSPVLRLYDQLEPPPGVGGLLRGIDRPDRDLLGIGPSRLRRPHSAGTSLCRCRPRHAWHPVSLGREQFRDLMSCARLSPERGGRDLAGGALGDLAMTRPETVRPHQGLGRLSGFFSNLICELGATLRNRTVDLLLTMDSKTICQPARTLGCAQYHQVVLVLEGLGVPGRGWP